MAAETVDQKYSDSHGHSEIECGNKPDTPDTSKASKGKKKAKKAKKPFLPLPTLEAVQNKLPWQLVFSQRLGRHAVASQEITAGQCVLAEAAVCALPTQGSCQHTCHSCLKPLPEASDELQLSQGVLLNKMSKHYKRYCSQKCCDADSTVSLTAPVHAKVSQIASNSKCDPTLLHFVLELDAQRQNEAHASFEEAAAPADARQQSGAKLPPGADRAPHDTLDVITCTLADVKALLSPWDRNQKSWREALTAGCTALQEAIEQAGTYKSGTLQQLQSLAACINANAHATGHQENTNSETGLGMYPVLSMFNHSCNPNLAHSSIGTVQYVYAVRDIKKGDELCVHYTSLYEPRRVRQQALLQDKFFSCACERCSVPLEQSVDRFLEGISCGEGQCREVLLRDTQDSGQAEVFKCVGCGRTAAARNVDGTGPLDMERQADDLYSHAVELLRQQGSSAARPVFEQLLEQCQGAGKLHQMHVRVIDSYMPLANGCGRTGDIVGAVKNVTAMIHAMEFYYSSPCIETTNLYRFLVELYADLVSSASSPKLAIRPKKQAKEAYQKYSAMKLVCQGHRHLDADLAAKMKLL